MVFFLKLLVLGRIIYEDLIFHEKKDNFSPKHANEIFKTQTNLEESMEEHLKPKQVEKTTKKLILF